MVTFHEILVADFCGDIWRTRCYKKVLTQSRKWKLPFSHKWNTFLQ